MDLVVVGGPSLVGGRAHSNSFRLRSCCRLRGRLRRCCAVAILGGMVVVVVAASGMVVAKMVGGLILSIQNLGLLYSWN